MSGSNSGGEMTNAQLIQQAMEEVQREMEQRMLELEQELQRLDRTGSSSGTMDSADSTAAGIPAGTPAETEEGTRVVYIQPSEKVALLRWLNSQSEEDLRLLSAVTAVQVGRELLNRITGQDKIDAYKKECVLSIAQFLRDNPRASQANINAEVEKRVLVFAARVKALEKAPIL